MDEFASVWVLTPSGSITNTSETDACKLIFEHPEKSVHYVFFYAELVTNP